MMVRPDVTGRRPSWYSKWHRGNGVTGIYFGDIDCQFWQWASWNEDNLVITAIAEIKKGWDAPLTDQQQGLLDAWCEQTDIGVYLIQYECEETEHFLADSPFFKVTDWRTKETTVHTEERHKEWIELVKRGLIW